MCETFITSTKFNAQTTMTQQERCRQSIVHCIYCARQHIKHTLHLPGKQVNPPLGTPFIPFTYWPFPFYFSAKFTKFACRPRLCELLILWRACYVFGFFVSKLVNMCVHINEYKSFRIIWQCREFSSFYSSYSAQTNTDV